MHCSNCDAVLPEDCQRCPHCGQIIRPVVEPELVPPGQGSPSGTGRPTPSWNESGERTGYSKVFYTTFPQGSSLPAGCTPFFVTLTLTLMALFMYGVLAAIGFLVFVGLGKGVSFMLTVRDMLHGRFTNPWLFNILTWAIAWFLVTWLSGNLE